MPGPLLWASASQDVEQTFLEWAQGLLYSSSHQISLELPMRYVSWSTLTEGETGLERSGTLSMNAQLD